MSYLIASVYFLGYIISASYPAFIVYDESKIAPNFIEYVLVSGSYIIPLLLVVCWAYRSKRTNHTHAHAIISGTFFGIFSLMITNLALIVLNTSPIVGGREIWDRTSLNLYDFLLGIGEASLAHVGAAILGSWLATLRQSTPRP